MSKVINISKLTKSEINQNICDALRALISDLAAKKVNLTQVDILRILESSTIYIAKNELGEIIATSTLVKIPLLQAMHYLIESVIVSSDYRNQGIATNLIEAMISDVKANSGTHISLTSNPKRVEARRLYQKLGFEVANTNVFRIHF